MKNSKIYNQNIVNAICCLLCCLPLLVINVDAQTNENDIIYFFPQIIKKQSNVTIVSKQSYYEVTIDLTKNTNHYQTGREYMKAVKKAVTNFEYLMDSYLEVAIEGSFLDLETCMDRVADIKPSLDQDYIDEVDGMASVLTSTNNVLGDGSLSRDELWVATLIPDVVRAYACSAVSIFGSASTNGNMIGRNLEWFPGAEDEMLKLHSVTIIKNGSKSVCIVGILGVLGAVSGFNTNRIFGAILDSATGELYDSEGKRSYFYDLRHALENYSTIEDVADYLKNKPYAFNHLILLGDPVVTKVLENNLDGTNRTLRAADSVLRAGVDWGMTNALGTVNSFLLPGNFDNQSSEIENYVRWGNMVTQTANRVASVPVDIQGLKAIIGYHVGPGPGPYSEGNIYVYQEDFQNVQSIIFIPSTWRLEIAFAPVGPLPNNQTNYQTIFLGNPF